MKAKKIQLNPLLMPSSASLPFPSMEELLSEINVISMHNSILSLNVYIPPKSLLFYIDSEFT